MNIKQILQSEIETEQFLESNQYLVLHIINKYCPEILTSNDFEDYMQEGMLSLYQAMLRYDNDRNTKFQTFAYIVVKHAILRKFKYDKRLANRASVTSLNVQIDESGKEMIDFLVDETADVEEISLTQIWIKQAKYKIDQARNQITPRCNEVLDYLLQDNTQAEISRILDCSRENVRQHVVKIKHALQA